MKQKQRFGNLNLGEKFEWGGQNFTKDGPRTATSSSRKPFVFASKDMVSVDAPEQGITDDFGDVIPGIGCISSGVAPDPQDLYDSYVYTSDSSLGVTSRPQDKCN